MPLNVIKPTTSEFKKYKYFNWTPGDHVIRLLDLHLEPVYAYWFNSVLVRSDNPDNPQEILNRRIKLENPENFLSIRGYRPARPKYIFRVFDKTVAKVCPNCGIDTKVESGMPYPSICGRCREGNLTTVEPAPINDIRIVVTSSALVDQLVAADQTVFDENGNKVGIENFDLHLYIAGVGKKRQVVVKPGEIGELTLPFELEPLNVDNYIFLVSDDEMRDLIRGISLRDILVARGSKKAIEAPTQKPDVDYDIKRKIDELF